SFDADAEILRHLRDVHDHALRTAEQIDGFRELLSNILNVNLTLVSVRQNEQVQKISAWAAILIVPTIITGIYGMNFRYMPELNWLLGYPFALLLMVSISALLYIWFRRTGWL
ncbi:MAG: CorA family divalent cation transporter, partial [Rubrobacteraceae bacterium]